MEALLRNRVRVHELVEALGAVPVAHARGLDSAGRSVDGSPAGRVDLVDVDHSGLDLPRDLTPVGARVHRCRESVVAVIGSSDRRGVGRDRIDGDDGTERLLAMQLG